MIEDRSEQFTAADERRAEMAADYESRIERLERRIDELQVENQDQLARLQRAYARADEQREIIYNAQAFAAAAGRRIEELEATIARQKESSN